MLESFLKSLAGQLASLVKEQFRDKRLKKSIDQTVHEAFTGESSNMLALCLNQKFAHQLFRLARGQTIDATDLVKLGASVSEGKGLNLTREQIIEELKQFALKLNNIFEEIAPEAGKKPDAFSNFFRSLDNLSMYGIQPLEAPRAEPTHFIVLHGRNGLLRHAGGWIEQIRALLAEKGQSVISESAALSGQGGVGKTAMAVEYAYRFAEEYPGGVYWFQMGQGLGSAALRFFEVSAKHGVELGPWQELTEPELIHRVVAFLNNRPLKLVILDNLEDNTLPKELTLKDVHLLVTTRRRSLAMPLVKMTLPEEKQALDIFLAYANLKLEDIPPEEHDAAVDICRRVDRLPQALEIMGQLASRRPLVSLDQNLAEEVVHLEAPTSTKELTSIRAALRLAEQEFDCPGAEKGLIAAGYLNPEGIEVGILAGVLGVKEKKAQKILEDLADLSILEVGKQAYAIHRLTQEAARLMDHDHAIGQTVALYLDKLIEEASVQAAYRQAYNLIPHVLHLACMAEDESPEDEFPGASLVSSWAEYLTKSGAYSQAETLNRTCLRRVELAKGQDHPDYATRLNNLAGVLEDQGNYEEAEALYRQALEIGEKTIGKDHPDYATDLNNLAGVLEDQGNYEEAEALCRQALEISRRILGPGHPQTRTIEENLDVLRRDLR